MTAEGPGQMSSARRVVELSHVITAGMVTYPGLPGPEITDHLTREASREHYAPGTEFHIGRISLVGNTGRRTPPCSRPGSRSWSTCADWKRCRRKGSDSPRRRP